MRFIQNLSSTFLRLKLSSIIRLLDNLVLLTVMIEKNKVASSDSCDKDKTIENLSKTKNFLNIKILHKATMALSNLNKR